MKKGREGTIRRPNRKMEQRMPMQQMKINRRKRMNMNYKNPNMLSMKEILQSQSKKRVFNIL